MTLQVFFHLISEEIAIREYSPISPRQLNRKFPEPMSWSILGYRSKTLEAECFKMKIKNIYSDHTFRDLSTWQKHLLSFW